MATFHRTEKGTAYLKITHSELCEYSGLEKPVCDECVKELGKDESITLIPILNQAYCPNCAENVLKRIKPYPEDAAIEKRREDFYIDYFGLE